MVIIITGDIGIGKTTVCEKVIDLVRSSGYVCGGILTYKAPDESLFVVDIKSGERATLASTSDIFDGPRTPRYSFSRQGIEFGIRAIDKGIASDVLVVDEIGHLELRGEGFANSLELIKAGRVSNAILVIRKQLLPAFLGQLSGNPLIFQTKISTRNRLPRKVCSSIIDNYLKRSAG